ncbi:ANTAR domain-containing response regulator [Streptomyces litchfieldiae]|uniref:ANTAR domain-containing protein n=1 Tax=Streptomyces litchfieldiae TaxID=3075543 RepID=A0ABU2MXH2_9ACTN|nr:ANTAR domain-containing protein [Streptomyces sp. DSM 44938]MDT0346346.1 ANTAR domain-containing protein [Streptomyces sp. DSM 44938]
MSASTTEQPTDVSARALARLAEEAALCAPGACGAAATANVDGCPPEIPAAVTHPDLAPLVAVQWEAGEGPIPAAVRTGEPAGADDLLADRRWPDFRAVALDAGVRSSATLPFRHDELTVTVTVCGFRPGLMDARTRTLAGLIGDLATRTLAHDHAYERALTEVDQLDTALRSRPVIDQACGILMHVLECDSQTAFRLLRKQSQRTNSKLADLAETVVRTRGHGIEGALTRLPPAAR